MKEHQHRGLTSAQVEESRRLHGDNLITPRKGDSAWKLFAEKFRDPIIQVLLVAALLSLAMAFIDGEFLETIGIICAIVLATCVGFFFELDAMRRFKRLNLVNDDIPVKVVRDGEMTEVPRRDVVVGDLVYVENGETVPADGKLVKAVSLKINESTLTGEPEVDKTTDERFFDAEATYPSDALLRGTTVVDGYGEMIVEAVGDRTEAAPETAGIEVRQQIADGGRDLGVAAGSRPEVEEGQEGGSLQKRPIGVDGVVRGVHPGRRPSAGVEEPGHALADVRGKRGEQVGAAGEMIEIGGPGHPCARRDGRRRGRGQPRLREEFDHGVQDPAAGPLGARGREMGGGVSHARASVPFAPPWQCLPAPSSD